MRFVLRIAGAAGVLLLAMLGTATAARWNPSPVFIQNDCTNGIRDYGSRLVDIPNGQDLMQACQNMPADFLDGTNPTMHHFNAPTRCEYHKDWLGNVDGVWGHFAVPEVCPRNYQVGPGCTVAGAGKANASLTVAIAALLGFVVIRRVRRGRRARRPRERV
jgi:hypothetical protein